MTKRYRLGMLTPSSNTALEPITTALLTEVPEVSVHFSRFPVTEISLRRTALGQFDPEPILAAARLLADARVDVIAWNGTSAGWLGFDKDEALCTMIQETLDIPTTTSVLALNEVLTANQTKTFALVTPYLDEVQKRILDNYQRHGYQVISERHLDDQGNFSFAEIPDDTIAAMVRQVAQHQPQAISTFCTNLRAAPLVASLEAELGIPIYDTISVVVWKSLKLAGIDTRRVRGWGQLFDKHP